jgi:nicotinamide-nucleotide amidase
MLAASRSAWRCGEVDGIETASDMPSIPLTCTEAQTAVNELLRCNMTVAVAESCTGGLVCAFLAGAAGGGEVLRGGVVAYDASIKFRFLNVARGPVVTAATARQMAEGAARFLDADVGLATTGVVGPDREEDQPVGTVFVAVAMPTGTRSVAYRFEGEPRDIRNRATEAALCELVCELATPPA